MLYFVSTSYIFIPLSTSHTIFNLSGFTSPWKLTLLCHSYIPYFQIDWSSARWFFVMLKPNVANLVTVTEQWLNVT
jgi:hypothetical protein